MQFGRGQPIRRKEDVRFITGGGCYTDDMKVANAASAAFVRSPHAHADIVSIDVSAAKAAPGVIAVFTGADYRERSGHNPIPCVAPTKSQDGTPAIKPPRYGLTPDRARHVGDPVAMVVAETRDQARDAADLVEVTYAPLPAVATKRAALAEGAPQIWDQAPGNLCFDWAIGDKAACDAAFDKAAHVTRLELVNNRIIATSMEPRACLAEYDAAADRYTFHYGSQGVFGPRDILAGIVGVKAAQMRVKTPDVGGGFGMKIFIYPEYPATLFAAREIGRPVKWTSERQEAMVSDVHGRDQETVAELALDADGRFLGVRVVTNAGMGAYTSQFGPAIPAVVSGGLQTGCYDIQAMWCNVKGVFTNTTPVDAYRGAGRPEAMYCIERLVDKAAREIGASPVALRLKNFIRPDQLPYDLPCGLTFDSGVFSQVMESAATRADVAGFEARRKAAAARGRLAGIGYCYYWERTGGAPIEAAKITVLPTGRVLCVTGTQSNGQGHETAFAQLVSEWTGVDMDKIDVRQGDSDALETGGGTGGSRSLTMSGGAFGYAWEKAEAKGREIAADALEAAPGDIEYDRAEGGRYRVVGSDRTIGVFEVAARAAEAGEDVDGLTGDAVFKHGTLTFPNGAHICEVEVDPDTGVVEIVRYTCVDDFGRVLNPMLVEGQVHGGVGQGVGQAMCEHVVYDESGQLLSGSLMDYQLPRAADVPNIDFSYTEDAPCLTNPLGVKGCGEAGAIGAPGSFVNAVIDALAERGVREADMPLTPEKVWRLANGAAA